MAKKKENVSVIEMLVSFISLFMEALIKIIFLIFDIIIFYKSGYKKKSGIGYIKVITDKGYYGEYVLYKKLIKIFARENVFTNLYLDNVNTQKTEIDLVVVSLEGVYVLEMKNYSGFIFGSKSDKEWTQVLNKRTKNKFYNPLRQNYAHVKALENYLKIDVAKMIPIVIFSNRSKLSKINIDEGTYVYNRNEAIKFIKNSKKKNEKIFTKNEVELMMIELIKTSNVSEEIKEKHIEEIQKLKQA